MECSFQRVSKLFGSTRKEEQLEQVIYDLLQEKVKTAKQKYYMVKVNEFTINLASMDEVQQEVLKAGYQFYGEAIARAMESGEYPPYKASGMAYIDFARREKHLFRLLFMRNRSQEEVTRQLGDDAEPLLGRSVVTDTAAVKNCIGVSPQETAVAPNLTARENLLLMCGVHGLPRQEFLARVEELARTLGLEPVLARRAGKLSGGWQRRLSIAMALVARPEILFLDEPTLGLDVLARAELWDVIRALKGRITVILTTHYMEEAEALSDRVGVMKDGRLLALGTPEELKAQTGCEKFEEAFIAIVKGAGK